MSCHHPVNGGKRAEFSIIILSRLAALIGCLAILIVCLPTHASANVITDWNAEFLTITQQTSGNLVDGPPEVARDIAIMGNAMSDAVNAATGSTISYYAYSGGSVAGADPSVAAEVAAYSAINSIFNDAAWQQSISSVTGSGNNTSNVTLANTIILPEIQTFLTNELGSESLSASFASNGSLLPLTCLPSASACLGYNLGLAAATAVTTVQSTDGAVASIQNGLLNNVPTTGPDLQPGTSGVTPGVYVPPTTRPEMLPTWGSVTPTGVTSAQNGPVASQIAAAQASLPGPPSIDSQAYAAALLETECSGSSQPLAELPVSVQTACANAGYTQETTAQANAALFWNDPGTTIQPPGHWLQIADTVMQSQGTNLLQSAQLTALLGDAENDAGIAAWGVKYVYNLWRPVTAIRNCASGTEGGVTWNPYFTSCDSTWSSLIVTPPHPDYVAGHPAFSGAGAAVLADFFGTDNITFSSVSNYYCNTGTTNFDSNNLVASCTFNGQTYYVSNPSDCANIVDGINTNDSPLICPITETYNSFTEASSGENGAEYSRIAGGIHTPFAVEDALTLGTQIGTDIAVDAGLPDVLPEPSTLALAASGCVFLVELRRRRKRFPIALDGNRRPARHDLADDPS
jgi:hypothetical protein